MLNIRFLGQFKKDYKKVKSQGFSKADDEELKGLLERPSKNGASFNKRTM